MYKAYRERVMPAKVWLFFVVQEEVRMKRIEMVEKRVSEIKTEFGNPRKITKKKKEELQRSLENYGDFGLILIDEHDNVIAGNMRVSVLKEKDPDTVVQCKRLIGYTQAELRAINIKDNTHSGEWDLDILADWTADLNLDLGLDILQQDPAERRVKEMELINYEKYDYVMIVCRNELDYNELVRKLGIEGAIVRLGPKKKIKARAIWYDQMKAQIVEAPDQEQEEAEDLEGAEVKPDLEEGRQEGQDD